MSNFYFYTTRICEEKNLVYMITSVLKTVPEAALFLRLSKTFPMLQQ